MTSKIPILTTCTITLATTLINLTPVEVRAMEGDNLNSNQEEISQTTPASGSDHGGERGGCIYVPPFGWVGDCD